MGVIRRPVLHYRTLWESSAATETKQLLVTAPSRHTIEPFRSACQPDEAIADRTLPLDWVFFPGMRIRMLAPTSLCEEKDLVTFWPQYGSDVDFEPAEIGTVCRVVRVRQFVRRPGRSIYEVVGLHRARRRARHRGTVYETLDEVRNSRHVPPRKVRRLLELLELFTPRVHQLGANAIDVAASSRIWPWGVRLESLKQLDLESRAEFLLWHLEKMTDDPVAIPVEHEQELRKVGLITTEATLPPWRRSESRSAPRLSVVDGLCVEESTAARTDTAADSRNAQALGLGAAISSFYGIRITMFPDKRIDGPHFHATYAGEDAAIDLEMLEILAGSIQPHGLKLVRTWAKLRAEKLWENWERLEMLQPPMAVDPLR